MRLTFCQECRSHVKCADHEKQKQTKRLRNTRKGWEVSEMSATLSIVMVHTSLHTSELTSSYNLDMCVHAKRLQSCLTLHDPMVCSLPGSSVHGISQARILEWIATPSSRGSSQSRDQTRVSHVSCIGRQVDQSGKP